MKVYLIYSDSFKRINEEVINITSNFNVIKYDLKVNNIQDVIEEANYFSLTGEKKYIVVKSNDFFSSKKNAEDKSEESLLKYLNNPNDNAILIFTSLISFDKRRKLYKKIMEIGKVIELNPYNKKELVYKTIDLLKTKGLKANYETCNYIVEHSFTNYDIVLSEIDKLYLYYKEGSLSIDDVKMVVSFSNNGNAFKFARNILNKNISECINMLRDLEILKIDPSIVIISIYKEFQMIYLIKTSKDIKNLQFLLGKENWQMNDYNLIKDNYTLEEIKKIIIKLADYDYKYKSGLIDKSIALDLITLDLCD
mgnify:CR=1 FL=1